MKITPLDIRRKEFRRSVRGYSDEEVDIFLDEVADEFERLFQENMELQDRAQRLDEQIAGHSQVRDALEKTLIAAQLQSEEIRANAHKESELILRDAQLKARGIVNDSYSETQKAQHTLVQVKRLEEEFRFKFRSLLEGYLKLLDDAATASAETETAAAERAQAAEAPAAEGPEPAEEGEAAAPRPAPTSEPSPSMPAPAPQAAAPAPPQAPIATAVAPAVASQVSQAPAAAPEARAVAPEAMVSTQVRPVAPIVEEEIPTEETEAPSPEAPLTAESYIAEQIEKAVADAADDVTAESVSNRPVPPPGEPVSDDSLRGFFFGRQIDDVDDTFPGEDGTSKQKGRDFEW
ncbi:MAG: DivIVA domain-containing protein [Thermoleophilia bacterium]|nr:DivIVA domain-containing protein [Thermoleophilia bacterium]